MPVFICLKIFWRDGTKLIIMVRKNGMLCPHKRGSAGAGILVCAQKVQMFKQPLAVQSLSSPGDYLIYNGGLSPFFSV